MSRKKNQGPRLYVSQSFSGTPFKENMQEIYTSKQKKEQLIEEGNAGKRRISLAKKEWIQEPIPIEINSDNPQSISSAQHPEKSQPSFKRVKPFKDLELKEKLDYLINFPKVLPPVPCVFYTADRNYQGYLTDYDQYQITITFHDQTSKTFPVEELKDIIMIGIKR